MSVFNESPPMHLVFLHSADWLHGKPFASVRDDAKRHRLQQERLHDVQRIADLVKSSETAFILIAHYMSDSSHATKANAFAACAAIGTLEIPVKVAHTNEFNLAKARHSKQMEQQLESVPNYRRTIAKECITRLMQRSFPVGGKLCLVRQARGRIHRQENQVRQIPRHHFHSENSVGVADSDTRNCSIRKLN